MIASGDAGAPNPAQNVLTEALRLAGSAGGAAALLAHSLVIAIEQLELARDAVSHGFVRSAVYAQRKE